MKKYLLSLIFILFLVGCDEEDFINKLPPNDLLETVATATVVDISNKEIIRVITDTGVELDAANSDLISVDLDDHVLINIDLESEPSETEWFITSVSLERKL